MLMGTLAAILLGGALAGKGVVRGGGRVIWAAEGVIIPGQGF